MKKYFYVGVLSLFILASLFVINNTVFAHVKSNGSWDTPVLGQCQPTEVAPECGSTVGTQTVTKSCVYSDGANSCSPGTYVPEQSTTPTFSCPDGYHYQNDGDWNERCHRDNDQSHNLLPEQESPTGVSCPDGYTQTGSEEHTRCKIPGHYEGDPETQVTDQSCTLDTPDYRSCAPAGVCSDSCGQEATTVPDGMGGEISCPATNACAPTTHTVTVNATKIVCNNESDLPNWGAGGHTIDAITAADFVAASDGACHLQAGWNFQWGDQNAPDGGATTVGEVDGYTTFGPTDESGTVSTQISIDNLTEIHLREVLQDGYIPFTGTNTTQDVSAEFYCTGDALNYDNWDFIRNPQADTTYNCVAFNVLKETPPQPPVACPEGTTKSDSPIETVSVPSNSVASTLSSAVLSSSNQYLIVPSGTWHNLPYNWSDAEYTSTNNWATHANGYDISPWFLGEGEFDLQIDGSFINWGDYTASHSYSYLYTGNDNPISLGIFDGDSNTSTQNTGWYSDNEGNLSVDIYSCISNTPQNPTGSIEITKYACPAETTVVRSANGVGGQVPEGCEPETGATFGYVHGTQTDANSPYPELSEAVTEAGSTTAGTLTITDLPADGRYLITETDGSGNKLTYPDSKVLGLYCEGDGDTSDNNDNQELTFVPENGVAHCVAYNKASVTPPVIENSCPAPSSLSDETTETVNVVANGEDSLQTILDNGGYGVNVTTDQKQYQLWNVSANSEVVIDAKFVNMFSAHSAVFGYYTDSSMANFVPVFKTTASIGGAEPVATPGDSFTINTGSATTIGFAIKSYDGSNTLVGTFATENALSTGGGDQAVVYNPSSNKYVIAFEDLTAGDFDYNDVVVEVTLSCQITCDANINLLANPSFESPVVTNTNLWDIFPNGTTLLDWIVGWTGSQSGTAGLELQAGYSGWTPYDGSQFAELDGNHPTTIYQDVTTIPGKQYELSFGFSPRPGTALADNQLEVKWDGNVLGSTISADGSSLSNTSWTPETYTNLLPSTTTTRLQFTDLGADNSLGTFIDNVSLRCIGDAPTLCTDETANNQGQPLPCTYNQSPIIGCMDESANNYDSSATEDTDPTSCTYNQSPIIGCMDESANNYDSSATEDTDPTSCMYNQQEETPTDVCPNIAGTQTTVPSGFHLDDGLCVANSSGGGGGGSGGVTFLFPNGGNGGGGDGESHGQVLGASTSCGIYMEKFLRRGYKNDPEQIKKLQTFLNENMNAGLPVTGFFGPLTEAAVKKFQALYADAILKPWGFNTPTGIVYLTTSTKINNIMCPELQLPIPTNLIPFNQH